MFLKEFICPKVKCQNFKVGDTVDVENEGFGKIAGIYLIKKIDGDILGTYNSLEGLLAFTGGYLVNNTAYTKIYVDFISDNDEEEQKAIPISMMELKL